MSAYTLGGDNAAQTWRCFIYNDSAGAPGTLVAVTVEVSIPALQAAGWVDFTFASPPALSAGTYWLGIWFGPTNLKASYYYDAGATLNYNLSSTYSSSSNPPSPFPAPTTASQAVSVYATYTPGGGGAVLAVPGTLDIADSQLGSFAAVARAQAVMRLSDALR